MNMRRALTVKEKLLCVIFLKVAINMHTDSLSLVEIKTKRRLMRNYTNTPSVWSSTYVNIIINTEIKTKW